MAVFVFAVFVGLLCFVSPSTAKEASPNVQVYSRTPGEFGKPNILICHVSGFYPPEINTELFKNGEKIDHAKQTDLAFDDQWHYYLTKHVDFTPNKDEVYTCVVTHAGKSKTYTWDPDM